MTDTTTLREKIARAICRARPMPACDCGDECMGPIEAILHPIAATADIADAVLVVIKQEHAAEIARLARERDEARAEAHRTRAAIRAEAFEEAAQYHDRAGKRALAAINAYSNFADDGEQRLLALRHARYAAAIRALAAKEPAADA